MSCTVPKTLVIRPIWAAVEVAVGSVGTAAETVAVAGVAVGCADGTPKGAGAIGRSASFTAALVAGDGAGAEGTLAEATRGNPAKADSAAELRDGAPTLEAKQMAAKKRRERRVFMCE